MQLCLLQENQKGKKERGSKNDDSKNSEEWEEVGEDFSV